MSDEEETFTWITVFLTVRTEVWLRQSNAAFDDARALDVSGFVGYHFSQRFIRCFSFGHRFSSSPATSSFTNSTCHARIEGKPRRATSAFVENIINTTLLRRPFVMTCVLIAFLQNEIYACALNLAGRLLVNGSFGLSIGNRAW